MPLGTKIKTQSPEFEKSFLRLSQLLSPKPTKRDIASFGGTRSVSMPKTGCNWNDGTAEPTPSSGNNRAHYREVWIRCILVRFDTLTHAAVASKPLELRFLKTLSWRLPREYFLWLICVE